MTNHNEERGGVWFAAFLKMTDEKLRNSDILTSLIYKIFSDVKNPQYKSYQVVDVGCGDGILAESVVNALHDKGFAVFYTGIDQNPAFIDNTRSRLIRLEKEKCELLIGDCFGEELEKLPKPSLVLVSHIAYYATDLAKFLDTLIGKMGRDTIIVCVHASPLSKHNKLRSQYNPSLCTRVVESIIESVDRSNSDIFKRPDLELYSMMFNSFIFFPKQSKSYIKRIVEDNYYNLEGDDKLIRNILEFILHLSMESVDSEGQLEHYIKDIEDVLYQQLSKFTIWTTIQIMVHSTGIYSNAVKLGLEALILRKDLNNFSPLHWAAIEGSVEIIEMLLSMHEAIALINLENFKIITPLYMAVLGSIKSTMQSVENFKRVIILLISKGADVRSIALSLELAMRHEVISISNVLSKAIKELEQTDRSHEIDEACLPRLSDCLLTNTTALQWFFDYLPTLMYKGSYFCDELVESAVRSYSPEILICISKNNDALLLGELGEKKQCISHIAAECGITKIFKLGPLYEELIYQVDSQESTILHYAAANFNEEFFNFLQAEVNQLNYTAKNKKYGNLLHYATYHSKKSTLALLKWLQDNKSKEEYEQILTERKKSGKNVIMLLTQQADKLALEFLRDKKELFLKQDKKSKNLLHYIRNITTPEKKEEILRWFIEDMTETLIYCAIHEENCAILDQLIKNSKERQILLARIYEYALYAVLYDKADALGWILKRIPMWAEKQVLVGKKIIEIAEILNSVKCIRYLECDESTQQSSIIDRTKPKLLAARKGIKIAIDQLVKKEVQAETEVLVSCIEADIIAELISIFDGNHDYKELLNNYKTQLYEYGVACSREALDSDINISSLCLKLTNSYYKANKWSEAKKYASLYLKILEKPDKRDIQKIVNALKNLGRIYSKLGEYENALDNYVEALTIARELYKNNKDYYEIIAPYIKYVGEANEVLKQEQYALKYYIELLNICNAQSHGDEKNKYETQERVNNLRKKVESRAGEHKEKNIIETTSYGIYINPIVERVKGFLVPNRNTVHYLPQKTAKAIHTKNVALNTQLLGVLQNKICKLLEDDVLVLLTAKLTRKTIFGTSELTQLLKQAEQDIKFLETLLDISSEKQEIARIEKMVERVCDSINCIINYTSEPPRYDRCLTEIKINKKQANIVSNSEPIASSSVKSKVHTQVGNKITGEYSSGPRFEIFTPHPKSYTKKNVNVIPIALDGNCLFNAILKAGQMICESGHDIHKYNHHFALRNLITEESYTAKQKRNTIEELRQKIVQKEQFEGESLRGIKGELRAMLSNDRSLYHDEDKSETIKVKLLSDFDNKQNDIFGLYVKMLRDSDQSWAGENEIDILAKYLKLHIKIYDKETAVLTHAYGDAEWQIIELVYNGSHYDIKDNFETISAQEAHLRDVPIPDASFEYESSASTQEICLISKIIEDYTHIEKQQHLIKLPSGEEKLMVVYIDSVTKEVKSGRIIETESQVHIRDSDYTYDYIGLVTSQIHIIVKEAIELGSWGGIGNVLSDIQFALDKLKDYMWTDERANEKLALQTHLLELYDFLGSENAPIIFPRKPHSDPGDFGDYGGGNSGKDPYTGDDGLMTGGATNGTIGANATDFNWT